MTSLSYQKVKRFKARLWRIYYWLFTDTFDEFSLKELLNLEYDTK